MENNYKFTPLYDNDEEALMTPQNIGEAFYQAKVEKDEALMKQCVNFVRHTLAELDEEFGDGEDIKRDLQAAKDAVLVGKTEIKKLKDKAEVLQIEENRLKYVKQNSGDSLDSASKKLVDYQNQLPVLKEKIDNFDEGEGIDAEEALKNEYAKLEDTISLQQQLVNKYKTSHQSLEKSISDNAELIKTNGDELKKQNTAQEVLASTQRDVGKTFKRCHPLMSTLTNHLDSRYTQRTLAQKYDSDSSKKRNQMTENLCEALTNELKITKEFTSKVYEFLANTDSDQLASAEFKQQDTLAKTLTSHAEGLAHAGLALNAALTRYNVLLKSCNKKRVTRCAQGQSHLHQVDGAGWFTWSYENIDLVFSTSFSDTEDEYCVAMPLPQQAGRSQISERNQLLELWDNSNLPMQASDQFSFEEQESDFPEALMWHLKGAKMPPQPTFKVPYKGCIILNANTANTEGKKCRTVVAYHLDAQDAANEGGLFKFWTKLLHKADQAKSHTLYVPLSSSEAMLQDQTSTTFLEQLWRAAKQHSGFSLRKVCVILPDGQWARCSSYAKHRNSNAGSPSQSPNRQSNALGKSLSEQTDNPQKQKKESGLSAGIKAKSGLIQTGTTTKLPFRKQSGTLEFSSLFQ